MKNVALLCYCLPEGMFNDEYSIIFSHLEVDERNECNAKSHVTSDFSFWCKVGMKVTRFCGGTEIFGLTHQLFRSNWADVAKRRGAPIVLHRIDQGEPLRQVASDYRVSYETVWRVIQAALAEVKSS